MVLLHRIFFLSKNRITIDRKSLNEIISFLCLQPDINVITDVNTFEFFTIETTRSILYNYNQI